MGLRAFYVGLSILALASLAVSVSTFADERAPDASIYYDRLLDDGRLDITIALSFRQKEGRPIPILGPILGLFEQDTKVTASDVEAFERAILKCRSCHFHRVEAAQGYRSYISNVDIRGRQAEVRLKLIYPTPNDPPTDIKRMFIGALNNDDVIIYSGHSRNGAGFPDFFAPFSNQGKVFVNDPIFGWEGFQWGYFARNKYQILNLTSCLTFRWYRDVIRSRVWEKAPADLALVLTRDDTFIDDDPETSMALVQGLIEGRDRDQILGMMEQSATYYHVNSNYDPSRVLFVGDGFLDETYAGIPAPGRVAPPRTNEVIP